MRRSIDSRYRRLHTRRNVRKTSAKNTSANVRSDFIADVKQLTGHHLASKQRPQRKLGKSEIADVNLLILKHFLVRKIALSLKGERVGLPLCGRPSPGEVIEL